MSKALLPWSTLACAAILSTSAAAAEQHLEVLFVSEGAGPIAYIEVTERSQGARMSRSAAWAFFAGGDSVTKTLHDSVQGDRRAPLLVDLPSPPVGLGITSDDDGTLVFSLDGLGDWQAALAEGTTLTSAAGGPAVASSEAARLLVEPLPPTLDRGAPRPARAVLYGTRGAIEGYALVTRRAGTGTEDSEQDKLLLPADDGAGGLVALPLGSEAIAAGRTFVADRVLACERAVSTALLLWPEGAGAVRLVASAAPACLPSGRAIVPLVGARLEPRKDVPIRAVLVDERAPEQAGEVGEGRAARLTSR